MSKDRTFQVPPSASASDLKDAAEMLLALRGVTNVTVTESRRVTLLSLQVCAVHEGRFLIYGAARVEILHRAAIR